MRGLRPARSFGHEPGVGSMGEPPAAPWPGLPAVPAPAPGAAVPASPGQRGPEGQPGA